MPKRVLHVIATLPVGGAENVLLSTLQRLGKEYQSVVCCLQEKGALGGEVEALGIPVIELHKLQRGGWDGTIVDALVKVIQQHRIDLVHSHLYHPSLYARFAANRTGIPVVITIHNTYAKRKWHRQMLNWYLGKRTARIITVSEAIREDVIRYDRISPQRVVTIMNGIDLKRSQSQLTRDVARSRLGLPVDAKVLVTIGRLVEQKGHTVLLTALAELADPTVHAVFAGDGSWRSRLEDQVRIMGLTQQVHFLGTRTDVGDILRAGDLYVMPSLWEGLGLALLEGMAAGLPVLTSRVGGMAEVLRNGKDGCLVPAGDAVTLAETLAELLAAPERMQKFAAAAQQRAQDFDADKMVAGIEQVYRQVFTASTQA
ncbi:glycosyltransferase [Chitinivorax sp. B]|uniref:glycosyltransferase n=1 Tax=Chitinivorax sp. B TaxID=2502235 RepID=UPI00148530ED|nr:glycosyltransferase [Chitinivorax sp. B]